MVDCDDIILMKEGSIVEQGNHDDLMKLNGDYAAMFNHFQLGEPPVIEVPVHRVPSSLRLSLSVSLKDSACVPGSQQEAGWISKETS